MKWNIKVNGYNGCSQCFLFIIIWFSSQLTNLYKSIIFNIRKSCLLNNVWKTSISTCDGDKLANAAVICSPIYYKSKILFVSKKTKTEIQNFTKKKKKTVTFNISASATSQRIHKRWSNAHRRHINNTRRFLITISSHRQWKQKIKKLS